MVRLATCAETEKYEEEYRKIFNDLNVKANKNTLLKSIAKENSNIRVFSRVRPLLTSEKSEYPAIICGNNEMSLFRPMLSVKNKPAFDSHSFLLDRTFGPHATNSDVYTEVCKPIVELFLKGGTGTVLAYGQTASGKTYTVVGCLKHISADIFKYPDMRYTMSVVEILGNKVSDLFNDKSEIQMLEDKFGRIQFNGIKDVTIENMDDFLNKIEIAAVQRKTETTMKNDTSSRSHMLVKLEATNTKLVESSSGILYIVDLAGSETANDRSAHSKDRLEETKLINTSLMTLKDCMRGRAVVQRSKCFTHIPYRASKLTLALRECFELAVRRPIMVAIIACVNPKPIDSTHSLNTLRYAAGIRVAPSQIVLKVDPKDPFSWNRDQCIKWIENEGKNKVSVKDLLPVGAGPDLVTIPEHEFIVRTLKAGKLSEKQALLFYLKLWALIVDARTRRRKNVLRARKGLAEKKIADERDELIRANSGGNCKFMNVPHTEQ